jgi:hypothetical protein
LICGMKSPHFNFEEKAAGAAICLSSNRLLRSKA